MPNRPNHYGIPTTSTGMSQSNLAYDNYVENAMTRAAMEKSLVFQQMQTALLGNMAGTLRNISNEMSQIRGLHEEALAIQQELLKREVIQQHLEEMIFQADKLVIQCSDAETDMPPSSRFFLLQGFLKTVEQEGIGTAIIKGRDNKAAFERVVMEASGLVQHLSKDPEVRQALAWAKKLEDQRHRKLMQIEQAVVPLRERIAELQQQRSVSISVGEIFGKWKDRVKSSVPAQNRTMVFVLALVLAACLFPVTFWSAVIGGPICFVVALVQRGRLTRERNAKIDVEIAETMEKLKELTGRA